MTVETEQRAATIRYVLRKATTSGNWGLFYWKTVRHPFTRFPRCSCMHCKGHATLDHVESRILQPMFLSGQRQEVVDFATKHGFEFDAEPRP